MITSYKIKYLDINLTKYAQAFYAKHYKILMKELKYLNTVKHCVLELKDSE